MGGWGGTRRAAVWAILLAVGGVGFSSSRAAEPLRITHGIASGDVTATEAVIWARANRAAQMVVGYTPARGVTWPPFPRIGPLVEARDDFTEKVVLLGLAPDTRHVYWGRSARAGRRPDPDRPSFFNFGVLRIAADGSLRVEIRDADGQVRHDDQGRPGAVTLTPTR